MVSLCLLNSCICKRPVAFLMDSFRRVHRFFNLLCKYGFKLIFFFVLWLVYRMKKLLQTEKDYRAVKSKLACIQMVVAFMLSYVQDNATLYFTTGFVLRNYHF